LTRLLANNKILIVTKGAIRKRDEVFNLELKKVVYHYHETTGKLDELMDRISELKEEGRKVLVFSQFTTMLDIIKNELALNDIEYEMLDGRTPQNKRNTIVNNFNNGTSTVFLISLKAGGTGLNLTSADTVIHCDPWWNPSVEEQASARVYRIGQAKPVQIIYLIAKGTIEEKINDVKQQKRELIEQLIQPGGEALSSLSVKELRQLLM
jgi:SNF2 family DNA or RNA helicase